MKKFKIALVGNTNVGKTTFLNTIGGFSQETSNYPGTTVEIFIDKIEYQNIEYEIIDLPGVYSLTPFSGEEKVTRDFLRNKKFDLVVQVIEPTNKKRSLSFTLELMELGIPLFLVINNKNDKCQKLDNFLEKIKQKLKISGIVINAFNPETKEKFFTAIANNNDKSPEYYKAINNVHKCLLEKIETLKRELKITNTWEVLKILEKDKKIIIKYPKIKLPKKNYGFLIRNNRYLFIEKYLIKNSNKRGVHKTIDHKDTPPCSCEKKCPHYFTDMIDKVLLNKWLGMPIFLFFMWVIFQATFTIGAIPMETIDSTFSILQEKLSSILPKNIFSSAFIEGAIGGVGATFVFLPPIMLLFFFLSILQQSGYLARTAYLLDNLMQKIGLSGKSSVPLLMGFGCNVPAIMATRSLSSKKERIITAMMIPFMSCGAKLPIYTLFISAFFATKYQGTILLGLYCFGILISLLTGIFFNKLIKKNKCPILLELPAYTTPKLKNIWQSVWRPTKSFLFKMGKVILPLSIILWFLFSFPQANSETANIEQSYAAQLGKIIEPVFEPLGFDWRISTGLIAGLGAKEVFISTFGALYSISENNEEGFILRLQNDPIFSPLTVFSLLVFILIYTPCIGVIATIKQEFGNKWAFIGLIYPTILAWFLSFLIYQIGQFLSF